MYQKSLGMYLSAGLELALCCMLTMYYELATSSLARTSLEAPTGPSLALTRQCQCPHLKFAQHAVLHRQTRHGIATGNLQMARAKPRWSHGRVFDSATRQDMNIGELCPLSMCLLVSDFRTYICMLSLLSFSCATGSTSPQVKLWKG